METFDNLKVMVTFTSILAMLNFFSTILVDTNALGVGVRVVLTQNRMLVTYFYKALSPKHQAMSIYKKEMLVVLMKNLHLVPTSFPTIIKPY
ncbi:hypothetical protein J1N35_035406 [Gossypium stocksii]|uniref:Reverse transcriptase/retrotransposon-derived protein RNase H-like domain-containing protein n=1 Tax=Gossypium stocksii TaxID=47602 RepID=A0A9D3UU82_9ROSI|nr:hypothetical protein J1N35_035406 [Gossypium stocksii]